LPSSCWCSERQSCPSSHAAPARPFASSRQNPRASRTLVDDAVDNPAPPRASFERALRLVRLALAWERLVASRRSGGRRCCNAFGLSRSSRRSNASRTLKHLGHPPPHNDRRPADAFDLTHAAQAARPIEPDARQPSRTTLSAPPISRDRPSATHLLHSRSDFVRRKRVPCADSGALLAGSTF
jgi:hypothetical protein